MDIADAVRILRAGGLVAFPTETVYGLGADGLSASAVQRIFEAKGRPPDNPLILHVADVELALRLWRMNADQHAQVLGLAQRFWPGPLTLVLPRASRVPDIVTAGRDTVGVRVPNHPLALSLLRAFAGPLAAPSANPSGRPSPTRAEHVLRTLAGRVDRVLDGGPTAVGVESTVLDLSEGRPRILRAGGVTAAMLREFLGELDEQAGAAAVRSPGTRHAHYRPANLTVELVDARIIAARWHDDAAVLCRQATAADCRLRQGERTAPLQALPDDAGGFARELYAALYRLEGSAVEHLRIERPPPHADWAAVADRLRRAAGAIDD